MTLRKGSYCNREKLFVLPPLRLIGLFAIQMGDCLDVVKWEMRLEPAQRTAIAAEISKLTISVM